MQELWVFCVLALWLTVNIYFLYCLEKRRPWAVETARAIALFEGSSEGKPPPGKLLSKDKQANGTRPGLWTTMTLSKLIN